MDQTKTVEDVRSALTSAICQAIDDGVAVTAIELAAIDTAARALAVLQNVDFREDTGTAAK